MGHTEAHSLWRSLEKRARVGRLRRHTNTTACRKITPASKSCYKRKNKVAIFIVRFLLLFFKFISQQVPWWWKSTTFSLQIERDIQYYSEVSGDNRTKRTGTMRWALRHRMSISTWDQPEFEETYFNVCRCETVVQDPLNWQRTASFFRIHVCIFLCPWSSPNPICTICRSSTLSVMQWHRLEKKVTLNSNKRIATIKLINTS